MRKTHKFLRCALAATLACGLMIPATALSAFADNENTPTPPLLSDIGVAAADEPAAQADGWQTVGPFEIQGGVEKDGSLGYTYTAPTLHIHTSVPITVRTPAQTSDNIEIDAGVRADLTLAGVDIATPANGNTSPINLVTNVYDIAANDNLAEGSSPTKATHANQIRHQTMLHLTLADGTTNTLDCLNKTTGSTGSPAIRCGWGSVLVIDDELRNLDKNNNIVTPVDGKVGADVTLIGGKTISAGSPLSAMDSSEPGILIASGGSHSAGIGAGPKENAGKIIVNGGDLRVSASGTGNADGNTGAAIGAGDGGSGTTMIFNGGKIDAQASYHGAGIGCGWGWTNPGALEKADAIGIPTATTYPADAYGYWSGSYFFNVAGDIYINGGYIVSKGASHGNAFGEGCGGSKTSNTGHMIVITGGTLLPTSVSGRYDIGGKGGYTIVTGGSVRLTGNDKGKFEGIGGTAFNTTDAKTWADVVNKYGGALPEGDKVSMVTIDLSQEETVGAVDYKVSSWDLYVNGEKRPYGAPSYLDQGKLYLWLSADDAKLPVEVHLSYQDGEKEPVEVEPIETRPGTDGTGKAKRWIKFKLEEENFPEGLVKNYDGLPMKKWSLSENHAYVKTSTTGDQVFVLDDDSRVSITYQMYKEDGTLGAASAPGAEMPSDTGKMHFTMQSDQYTKVGDPYDVSNGYWGFETEGDCEILPVPAVVKISEKDGTAWVRLSEDGGSYELVEEDDVLPGNRLRVAFDIRSAKGTAVTCKAPTGKFQVMIDGQPVGEPIALTKEAVEASLGSSFTVVTGEEGRETTRVVYYLDPTKLDGALDVLETAGQGNTHEVTVQYQPDKNYVEGTEENPENEASKPTTIVPVKPTGDIEPEGPGLVVTPSPDPEPGPGGTDPDNPTGKMTVIRKTITASYGDFHSADNADLADFFALALDSNTSSKPVYSVSNTAVATLLPAEEGKPAFGEGGAPALDDEGRLQIQVNSCGTSVITVEQKPNALFTGIKYILTINVLPDPTLKPQVQIRLTWRNLTALGEQAATPMLLAVRALETAADAVGAPSPRATSGRAHTPPRPGDVLEYTVTGLNLTPGSAWQAAELKDAIDQRLSFDEDSVELAPNYATRTDKSTSLGSDAFYDGFDWDGLEWAEVARGASDDDYRFDDVSATLSKAIGTVYGGQSTSVRFRATVAEDEGLGDRPGEDGKLPEITNEPDGTGGYGKPEGELKPGETPTDPTPLEPEDIEIIGNADPVDGKPSPIEPTPVLPKDPAAADIVTTVKVEQTGHTEEHDGDRFMVGDTLTVTVTATNKGPDSKLANAVVKATLPVGMEPKEGTIKLVDGEGNVHDVPMDAYDPKTGIIAVNAGDLYFGDDAVLTFDVEVISTSETRLPTDPDVPTDPDDPSGPGDPDDPDAPGPTRPTEPTIEGGTLGETPTDEWEREHPTDPDVEPADPDADPKPGTPFEPGKPWEDVEDEFVSTPPAVDPTMPPVLPSNPKLTDDEEGPADISVAKEAENLDSQDGTTHVGDVVRYTVTLSNAKEHSMWYDAVIRDDVPEGLEPLSGSIKATGADGVAREVPDSAYDPASRVLAVAVGDLPGGRVATLTFDALVTEEAVGADIGNVASAFGTRPSDAEPGEVAGGAPRPVPGVPFEPEEGWDSFLEGRPDIANPAPSYPAGVTDKGGVMADPRPEPDPEDPNGGGAAGADGQDGAGSRTPIRLAQTGDELLAPSVALVMAAAAAGVMLTALMAQRSRRREELRARYVGRW